MSSQENGSKVNPIKSKFSLAASVLGPLSVPERILLCFCKHPSFVPGYDGYAEPSDQQSTPDPLQRLRSCFPDLSHLVTGADVLDFGCGDGGQAIALAQNGAHAVVGVDIQEQRLDRARQRAANFANLSFATHLAGMFDTVICQDAFEHIAAPEDTLASLLKHVKPGGRILLTFGPLWYAPYGAHCHFFTRFPWVHLIFSEATVHRVMRLYRRNPGSSYLEEMNMMTVARFKKIVRETKGCSFHPITFRCVKGLNILASIPIVRELLVNEVSCVISN